MAYCAMRPTSQVPWIPADRCGFNRILGICPTHLLSGGSVFTERNVTLNFKYFQENPETIFQFVFDQPLFAFRIQRPAFAPLFKLPSASHRGNRPFSVTSPLFIYKGKAPLSGCCLPFTPGAVWRNAGDESPARARPAIARIQNPEASIPAIVQLAQRKPLSLSRCSCICIQSISKSSG